MREYKILPERVYLMCPNMFFGIMARIRKDFDSGQMRDSLDALCMAHPLIGSSIVLGKENKEAYYVTGEKNDISFQRETRRSWHEIFRAQSESGWDVRKEKLLKIYVFEEKETFQILFLAHHILCDERSLLTLICEFADHYVKGDEPAKVEDLLIDGADSFTRKSDLPFTVKRAVREVNNRWENSKYRIGYEEYLLFESEYGKGNPVRRRILNFSERYLEKILAVSETEKVSPADILIARMMKKKDTKQIVLTKDIRERLKNSENRVTGNYSVSFDLNLKNTEADTISLAKRIRSAKKNADAHQSRQMQSLLCCMQLHPELIDAAAISAFGSFPSEPGLYAADKILGYKKEEGYGFTDLGSVTSESMEEAFFIPTASPANRATWGALTLNGKLKVVECASPLRGSI